MGGFFRTAQCLAVATFLIPVTVFLIPVYVRAQTVQDFVITSFTADYTLSNEDPQGLLTITERIELDFSGQNRGILRAIPDTYNDIDTNVSVLSVARDGNHEPFIIYSENGNSVIRIGDESTYITGEHSYVISYQIENVITFYDSHDELFWDVNGDQWLQPFNSVVVAVDSDVPLTTPNPVCFTGAFGSTESACEVKRNTESFEVNTSRQLAPSETLTVIAAYEKGFFEPLSFAERYRRQLAALPFVLILMAVVLSAHRRWVKFGKEYETRGLVAPFFGRPKGLSVMQAGYVHENKLTPQHMSASIIDLAIRGYITITERKKGKSTKHDITLKKKLDSHLSADEKELLRALVGDTVGATVEIESKKNKLHKTYTELKKKVDSKTTEKGFYDLSPKKAEKSLIPHIVIGIIGVIIGFAGAEYTKGMSAAASIIALLAIFGYRAFMSKRSRSGNMLVEHMEGLKLYLSKAEKDRIAQQDAVAAPLSKNSHQPVRDVAFFEKLLPFAVAMSVEKSWAKAFSDIYTQPPEWYNGNWNTFTTAHLVSGLSSTAKATSASFSAPSSSGSSGFSGGGFSGGGGGGGGGGGW